MTRLEFIFECNSVLVEPALALENELIREALARGYDEAVKELLASQF